jgi:alpha-N-arabinofuranosidase
VPKTVTSKGKLPLKLLVAILVTGFSTSTADAHEWHVAQAGNDMNAGTADAPFRTIQHAADLAQPGDVVTVHAGIYRERVTPPRGGTSDRQRITYQAAPGEKVTITGSEEVKNWEHVGSDTWKVTLPNSFFGDFNPYREVIHGDWYESKRANHLGMVYLNGSWMAEALSDKEVLAPADATPLWYATVDEGVSGHTTIWAQFKGVNPNQAEVEINVRPTVFTPEKTGINYIVLRGFTLRDAATNWAPPDVGQIGLVTAYWCKGWIIEDNDIAYSRCCGIALGKYGEAADQAAKSSADSYTECVRRALANGWDEAAVGSHIVRNNRVSYCGQTGIVGSMGCSFSTVTGSEIHDIHIDQPFSGEEMAGIKFHGAIDVTISDNNIYHCDAPGIWLDWMGQGAHVTGNLMHENKPDIFLEMQHGPILLANNLLLSRTSLYFNAQGISLAHNLILGKIAISRRDRRVTPFQRAHSTAIAGMYPSQPGDSGDNRSYNNLFVAPSDARSLDDLALPSFGGGNVYAGEPAGSKLDANPVVNPSFVAGGTVEPKADGWYLTLDEDLAWRDAVKRQLVTTALLGEAKVTGETYENANGSPLEIATDYLGNKRNPTNPFPGPFEITVAGKQTIKVWPKPKAANSN